MELPQIKNQMLFDMATENRKIIHGAFYGAIREITGRDPDQLHMKMFAGIVTYDHQNWVDYTYYGQTILRAYAPEIIKNNQGKVVEVHQKIEQIWKKRPEHRRKPIWQTA